MYDKVYNKLWIIDINYLKSLILFCLKYKKYKHIIYKLLNYYNIEQLIDFSLTNNHIYYDYLYHIYLYHINYINKLPICQKKLNIKEKQFNLSIWFIDNIRENTDMCSSYSMVIYFKKRIIFSIAVYIWKNVIFISNIQLYKDYFLSFFVNKY